MVRGFRIMKQANGTTDVTWKVDPALEAEWRGASGFPNAAGFYMLTNKPDGLPSYVQPPEPTNILVVDFVGSIDTIVRVAHWSEQKMNLIKPAVVDHVCAVREQRVVLVLCSAVRYQRQFSCFVARVAVITFGPPQNGMHLRDEGVGVLGGG